MLPKVVDFAAVTTGLPYGRYCLCWCAVPQYLHYLTFISAVVWCVFVYVGHILLCVLIILSYQILALLQAFSHDSFLPHSLYQHSVVLALSLSVHSSAITSECLTSLYKL